MNASEIIKNIIPDGLAHYKESIWERLLLPDFNEPEPQSIKTIFNTPEEWLDAELQKIALSNLQFEREYHAAKPLMTEEEYAKCDFSNSFKKLCPDYFEYKRRWETDHKLICKIEKSRIEVNRLFDIEFLDFEKFRSLNLLDITLSALHPDDHTMTVYYNAYKLLYEKSRTNEGKQNILDQCVLWWCWKFHETFIDNAGECRQKANELKSYYKEKWMQLIEEHEKQHLGWDENRRNHESNQRFREKEIEDIRCGYLMRIPDSISALTEEILQNSDYNFYFKKDVEIDLNSENKLLLVEYALPSIENLPNIKETKVLRSKGEFKNILVSQNELFKLFDEAVYSITLRSIYELFANDELNTIQAINFNGWVKSINKATGKMENTCIISIQVQRNEFMEIDLERVDPKTCFKHFKGIGSSKLHGITAIQPILQIKKNDKRFVDTHLVDFDDSTNLAIMPWEDFEHLIREIFEKEFSSNGGEVKVTQASRDGGVDAVAFDPDPIRGGKIVIQAKRYTNTVGVSSVRDLYGTVLNEGANKGILVTTSDYGLDSYEFAKGKPLTLLNGANLLYLLEKHGTRARIDIKEARRLMKEEK